ncbi:MAG TPA: hypothetical protein VF556_17705 [Pyrinomonadaceae bacterium]|jgi:chromosome segregation ATPase
MKILRMKTFLIAALVIVSSSPVFTQTVSSNTAQASPSPTPEAVQTQTETIKTDETISFLLQDNENKRALIFEHQKRITYLETQIALEQENSTSLGKSYDAAQTEISFLKKSNEAYTRAIATNEQTIAMLQSDNVKQREKAKKAVKDKWKAYAAAAVSLAVTFLIPKL